MRSASPFVILGANVSNPNWDGSPMTLNYHESASMRHTPDGSMVLACQNTSEQNNLGKLTWTSGGSKPQTLTLPWGANASTILVQNWGANNLTLTNVSINSSTPLYIQAYGPGMPGQTPKPLPIGPSIGVQRGDTLQGNAAARWMQLGFQCNSGELALFALIGGPPDGTGNNAYVFSVNDSGNTGPGTNAPAPAGYYSTTTGNTNSYEFNWGSSTIFVAYFGSGKVAGLKAAAAGEPLPTVSLVSL